MASTYEKIATSTLGSAQASYTFTSIPNTYTDLVLIVNGKTTGSGGYTALSVRLNSDSGNNYSRTGMYGAGGSASAFIQSGISSSFITIGQAANNFGSAIVNFQDYSNATTYKTFLSTENYSSLVIYSTVSLWRNTNAITSITLSGTGGHDIASGSIFNLYGIKEA
jgi:hypothetical protein